MMNIFYAYELERPPFKDHKEHMHTKKNRFKIVRDESKLQLCHLLRKGLFTPNDPSNVEMDHLIEELGSVLASTLLREFADMRKATHQHLSAINGKLLWAESSTEEKLARLGTHANNNVSESTFGILTENITKYSMIGLAHAGAISQSKYNGDFRKELVYSRRKMSNEGMNMRIAQILVTHNYYSQANRNKIAR